MQLDHALGDVIYELESLHCTLDLPLLRACVRDVDRTLGELCDAAESGAVLAPFAAPAFAAVVALGQLLDGASAHDPRIDRALDYTRSALVELLDLLSPYVAPYDRTVRRVALVGESVDEALRQLNWTSVPLQ